MSNPQDWSNTWDTAATSSNLRLATLQHRVGAVALDAALCIVTLGIGWIIWSMVVWGQGQTPGKKILKLRVYAANSQTKATWGHMAVREFLLKFAIGLSFSFLNLFTVGFLGTLGLIAWYVLEIVWYYTKGSRTFRDHLVKTLVVNEA
jgi:uncharacterized RDD family membrane protein YckC